MEIEVPRVHAQRQHHRYLLTPFSDTSIRVILNLEIICPTIYFVLNCQPVRVRYRRSRTTGEYIYSDRA